MKSANTNSVFGRIARQNETALALTDISLHCKRPHLLTMGMKSFLAKFEMIKNALDLPKESIRA